MPLYEYLCDSCGHRFESIQKFSDPPIDRCPKCGGAVRKLQSAPEFQFKGSGWYINDSRAKNSANGSSTDDKAEAKNSDDSKTSETSKPEPAKTAAD